MKKLMIPAIVALMSVGALAEDAAKPAEGAAAPAAAGGDCKVVLKADDAMKFDLKEFKINKAACPEFTVELDHVGKLPAAAMGHNVVITKTADVDAVAQAGIKAGPTKNYVDGEALRGAFLFGGEKAAGSAFVAQTAFHFVQQLFEGIGEVVVVGIDTDISQALVETKAFVAQLLKFGLQIVRVLHQRAVAVATDA